MAPCGRNEDVSIAFRLNARLKAAVRANNGRDCDPVSIAFRLNARLKGPWHAAGSGPTSSCLNCLSAECSIESRGNQFVQRKRKPKVSIAFRLNARLKVGDLIRERPRGCRPVSIAFRLNARLKGVSRGRSDRCGRPVSIAFRLNARLKAGSTRISTRPVPPSLNCLSAECSIESGCGRRGEDPHGGKSQLPFG